MNRHQFHQIAKQFRAGRITINQFADQILGEEKSLGRMATVSDAGISGQSHSSVSQIPAELKPILPPRPANGHKGTFGHVLIVGGSQNMAGAPALAAMAAARSGCGLVTVATSSRSQPVVAGFDPIIMTAAAWNDDLNEDANQTTTTLSAIENLLQRATSVAIGPGMGRSAKAAEIVCKIYSDSPLPVVVDAEALNVLAETRTPLEQHSGPRILTPHPGELRRLLVATGRIEANRTPDLLELERLASALATDCGIVMVVKSHQTLVSDGSRNWRCEAPANSGLATGGTGDVLAGIMAAICAQKVESAIAAVTAVAIHAAAARHAVEESGPASMVATDLIKHLSAGFMTIEAASQVPDHS